MPPEYHYELKPGDYVLFYLSQEIKGGRSIIAKARSGSPYLEEAKHTERNGNPISLNNGVLIIPIEKREYDSIYPPIPGAKLHPQHSVGIIKSDSRQK